jgi:hypothetical protein
VVEVLGAGAVVTDVVGTPAGGELVTAGRELADEVVEISVMGVPACFGAEHGDGDVGGAAPVGVEAVSGGVEEREPGEVGAIIRIGEDVGVEGSGESVGGEDVHATVADEGEALGEGVENPLEAGAGRRRPGAATGRRRPACSGVTLARRDTRKSLTSARLSTFGA